MGATYRYAVKIKKNFKQWNKWQFKFAHLQQQKHGKGGPKSLNKGQIN
jgi:hypothetical protein